MQEKKDSSISVILKGICVGGTMLVPGCSGGSMAMILGVYDRLVSSVSSFMKHKKESLFFLTLFCLGGGLGMILFARPMLSLMERFEMPMLYFFIGAIAGSVPMILKKASWEKGGLGKLLFFLAGAAVCPASAGYVSGGYERRADFLPAAYPGRCDCRHSPGAARNKRFLYAASHGNV